MKAPSRANLLVSPYRGFFFSLSLSFVGLVVVACSSSNDSSGTPTTGDASPAVTSCADVCKSVARCNVPASACASSCATFSETERTCIAKAADCTAIDRCTSTTASDSGAPDTSRPPDSFFTCDSTSAIKCKITEYCAQDTKHSAGCFPIPPGCTSCDCVKTDALAHYPNPSGSNPYVCGFATCAEAGGGFHISCR